MTPKKFVAGLDAWSAEGGEFLDSVPDRHRITTPAEAEAVCRALDSEHAVNCIETPAFHDLAAFFQSVETEAAAEVFRIKGLDRLRRLVADALDRPLEPDTQEYAFREPYDSCVFLLKVLAMYAERGDGSLIIRAARDRRRVEQILWCVVFDFVGIAFGYLDEDHPDAGDIFEALREPLPIGEAGVAYLNWANAVADKQPISRHPFASAAGIARLAGYLGDPDPEHWVNASCAVAALPFVDGDARMGLLDIADRHPDSDVRLEAAAARARTGSEIGAQRLAQLCLDPRLADRAIEHLEQLGLAIPPEARDPGFRAMAEMCTWLSYPTENGRPPDEITLYDTRVLNWPPTGDRRQLWIDGDEAEEDFGLVGSTTFALSGVTFSFYGEIAAPTPEDVYGLHCCWELQMKKAPKVPRELSASYGRKMLAKANPRFVA